MAGATHVAVATDHVIESFRNGLWPGYKTGAGIEPDLLAQFPLLEDALSAAGVVVWPMVEFEADDALAAAAVAAARDARVERVIICTPDKDLAQCVRGTRIVQLNRRTRVMRDEAGVIAEVRRLARVDPRLPGAGGRRGRRISGPARLGGEVVGGRPRQVRPSRVHSGGLARVERERRQRERARTHARHASGTARCSFEHSPHCEPTSRCSTTWTSCDGPARHPPSLPSRHDWTRRSPRPGGNLTFHEDHIEESSRKLDLPPIDRLEALAAIEIDEKSLTVNAIEVNTIDVPTVIRLHVC